jgi:signal transduction histidine kinase/ActR/RegA family two-component response regulator
MDSIPNLYRTLLLCFGSIMICFGSFSQEAKTDTIATIKQYQQDAETAIRSQDFDVAIVNLTKANKLISKTKNDQLKAEIQLETAELHYFLQNYEKAATDLSKAISLLNNLKKKEKLGHAYNLNGLILTQLGQVEEAEAYLKDADALLTRDNDEAGQANVILSLGLLELKKQNYKASVNYFDAGIPIFNSYNLHYQEALSYIKKADGLLNLETSTNSSNNFLTQADIALEKGMEIADARSFSRLQAEGYRVASYIALRQNNYELAQQYIDRYETQKDSLQQVYLKAISKGVDADSNIFDLNEQIATQKDELDKQKKSINFGKMTTGLSIALIVILSLLTLSLYKNNNLRAKANELLQDKNNELQLAKEKAEKASLAKAQFLSTITHELRTPLYAVTGLTHLLLEENPMSHQKEHLNSLKFSGEYLLSLINNILDLNKLEANKVEIEKTTFSLKKRINDVLVALKKSADDRKNNLHFEFDESIPSSLVGDPLKLSQILINLIGNSVKFTQNGDVSVRVKKLEETNSKVKLHFEIEDNGVGISKKKQKSIFETFSQASLQINRKFGGTGLGLSIVKNLLELMGSKIHLESQLGKGSKFWFNINFDVSEEIQEDKNPKNVIYDVDYVALENRKILVVEDNKINQMITRKILEKNKMKCMVADNGMEAIKLVEDNDFDVILMDIHMPGISGIEATQKIREFNKQIPIIALTAVTIDENLDDFYRAGFNEIIPKPFKTEEFFEKIYRTLESKTFPINN